MGRRASFVYLITVLTLVLGMTPGSAGPPHPVPVGSDRTVTVMTRNLYFGADLEPVIAAQTPEQFLSAAVGAFEQAQASDFRARAAAMADEIAAEAPALVGMQEATWWRVGPLGDAAPAETPLVDFVGLIVDALADRGADYVVLESVEGFDAELPVPAPIGLDVRLTVGDVLLARADMPTSRLKLSNLQSGQYATTAVIPTPIGNLPFTRQWISVDAKVWGRQFRFVTTHLESIAAPFRIGQAMELRDGPADTGLPVVAVGDFNAPITAAGDASSVLLAAGFVDAWGAVHPGDPGPTCCQDADLRNPVSDLTSRIDLVLTRGGFTVADVRRVGVQPDPNLSPLGVLYPSDHAGVVADLVLR